MTGRWYLLIFNELGHKYIFSCWDLKMCLLVNLRFVDFYLLCLMWKLTITQQIIILLIDKFIQLEGSIAGVTASLWNYNLCTNILLHLLKFSEYCVTIECTKVWNIYFIVIFMINKWYWTNRYYYTNFNNKTS